MHSNLELTISIFLTSAYLHVNNHWCLYYCVYTIVLLFLFVGPMLVQVYLPLCPAVFFSFSANKFDLI